MNKSSNSSKPLITGNGMRDVSGSIFPLHEDEPLKTCPTCEGTGTDRWEEDMCTRCWGEGEI